MVTKGIVLGHVVFAKGIDTTKGCTGAGSWCENYADPIQVPSGPITRARAKKIKEALMTMVQEMMSKAEAWRSIEGDREQEWKTLLIQVSK